MAAEKKEKKKPPKFLILTGIAAQMGLTIYAGAFLGKYIDRLYFPNDKPFTISCTLLSLVIAFYFLLKKVNQLNEKDS